MNFKDVLRECGALDREIDHLVGCDACKVEADIESLHISRCPANPQRLHDELHSDLCDLAWMLFDFFGVPRPRGIPLAAVNVLMNAYVEQMHVQIQQPVLFDTLRMTRSGA